MPIIALLHITIHCMRHLSVIHDNWHWKLYSLITELNRIHRLTMFKKS